MSLTKKNPFYFPYNYVHQCFFLKKTSNFKKNWKYVNSRRKCSEKIGSMFHENLAKIVSEIALRTVNFVKVTPNSANFLACGALWHQTIDLTWFIWKKCRPKGGENFGS